MTTPAMDRIRAATAADAAQLLRLWALVFDEDDTARNATWWKHAHEWFARLVEDRSAACFPVIQVDAGVVATAIGTLEPGVPNPNALVDGRSGLRTSSLCPCTGGRGTELCWCTR